MSAHFGLVCIKGSHLTNIKILIEEIGWENIDTEKTDTYSMAVDRWNHIHSKYEETFINSFIATETNGWTIFLDGFFDLCTNIELLKNISKKLNAEILSGGMEGSSGTYSLVYIKNNNLIRHFECIDGNIEFNYGEPLIEEDGLNLNESVFEDDINSILIKKGIDYEKVYTSKEQLSQIYFCQLPPYQLEELKLQVEKRKLESKSKKPKWKFW